MLDAIARVSDWARFLTSDVVMNPIMLWLGAYFGVIFALNWLWALARLFDASPSVERSIKTVTAFVTLPVPIVWPVAAGVVAVSIGNSLVRNGWFG